MCPYMSRNEPIIRERTAITVPVQNLYDKKSTKRRKKAYVLPYVSQTQPFVFVPYPGRMPLMPLSIRAAWERVSYALR